MSFCLKIKIILQEHDYVRSHLLYFNCYKKTLEGFSVILCGFDPTMWMPQQSEQYFLSFYGHMD